MCLNVLFAALLAETLTIPFVPGGETSDYSTIETLQNRTTHRMTPRPCTVRLWADEEALHAILTTPVEESDPGGGFVAVTTQDGKLSVCQDDDIELFVAAEDGSAVYQTLFNSRDVKASIAVRGKEKDSGRPTAARSSSVIANGQWTLTARLPWADMPGVDKRKFRFNAARNFVRAGLGYASLTGQTDVYDAKRMIAVRAVSGCKGFRLSGLSAEALADGRVKVSRDGGETDGSDSIVVSAYLPSGNQIGKLADVRAGEAYAVPMDTRLKRIDVRIDHPTFGRYACSRAIRFETGRTPSGGPVTEKREIAGLGFSHVRFYPGADRLSVAFDGLGADAKDLMAELVSPGGEKIEARPVFSPSDRMWTVRIPLPPEAKRAAGEWRGCLTVGESRYENAFGFVEKKFPWQGNRLGISDEILQPFTPIETDGVSLSTVLRRHTLSGEGLISQVQTLGRDILACSLAFELACAGDSAARTSEGQTVKIVESKPNRVLTEATASFGDWTYEAQTEWDYDGFALTHVRLTPQVGAKPLSRFSLTTALKASEARLFHALVDMPRGNPAGDIPAGTGEVWNSSRLPRRAGKNGAPMIPGEFVPYLWLGGEERGLSLLFDSPRGFDLEDGKPMMRLLREGESVVAVCDIVSRSSGEVRPVEFSFAFQVTPVKPKMPGSEKWCFHTGDRFPGLLHICPYENVSSFGFTAGKFEKVPRGGDYSLFAGYHEALAKRRVPYDAIAKFEREQLPKIEAWAKGHEKDFIRRTSARTLEKYTADVDRHLREDVIVHGMTADRVLPYTCPTIFAMDDEAYRYCRAEWSTFKEYNEGVNDRVFLRPNCVDYLVWCYDKMLEAGVDGIYFDEVYVIPQTNPDLSEVRDYKGRVLPETGLLQLRELIRRTAYVTAARRNPQERLQCIHHTNTLIIPAYSFATLGLCWEYHVVGNFQNQFKPDYVRAVSTGRQTGLVSMPLLLPKVPDRAKMKPLEYLKVKDRYLRTGLGIAMQHEMYPYRSFWGLWREEYFARYVPWAYGTHLGDCTFTPYWAEEKPFSASGNFLVGAYRRGATALFILTNMGSEAETELTVDRTAMGLKDDAVLMDVTTGERFPLGRAKVRVAECDYRWLFAGPAEFGTRLKPVEPDKGFVR